MASKRLKRALIGIPLVLVAAIGGVVAYANLTYKHDFASTPKPDIKASTDPKVIEHGAYVTHAIAHCSACHGNASFVEKHTLGPDRNDLRGGYTMHAGPFGTFYAANLTPDPETGLGKLTDAELARVIRHGVSPEGRLDAMMAFAVGPMSDEDLTAIVSYLRSLPPVRNPVPSDEWGLVAKVLSGKFHPRIETIPKYAPPGDTPTVERGAYLANGPAVCSVCHTPRDPLKGFVPLGPLFSGGAMAEPDSTDPEYEIIAPNLTSDPATGVLVGFTEESFVDRVRKVGQTTKGSPMPWDNFKQMTDSDLKSIFLYLKTLPPAKNVVGPARRKKGWKPDKT
jgi:mono/diheme cytochrome c family protein